jgi:Bifunctional DNA primase/polymerase, N-terminal/AAA domain
VSTTPIFQAALDRGLSIIPIPPREKGCKLPLWQELAAPDASLMEGCEGYNYGVVANDTFCILDIDNPEAFHNELSVKLPTTYTVATSRGKHLYFRHTDKSRRLGNRSGSGVFDFQADSKYVIGEGSTHPSGHVYSCVDSSPISEIPDSQVGALERFVVQRKRERARLGLKAGDREDMHYAGSIYTDEITEEEMLEKLIERNDEYSEEPLSLGDLQRMVTSAFKKWEHAKPAPEVQVGRVTFDGDPDDWKGLFHSYDEVVNTPEPTYAINGWCLENEIIMYGGLPGHGKTLLGLSTAKALLTGEPLFGYEYFKLERSKRVLYLCPEVGLRALRHRLKAFRLLPFIKSGQLLIRSLSAPEVPLMDPRILRAAEGADVFLDTAVRFMEGEENSSSEQRVFAKNLFTLLRTGARTVTGLHHSPKFAKGAGVTN